MIILIFWGERDQINQHSYSSRRN